MTGMCSEKCVIRQLCDCVNIREYNYCKPKPYYRPRLDDIAQKFPKVKNHSVAPENLFSPSKQKRRVIQFYMKLYCPPWQGPAP